MEGRSDETMAAFHQLGHFASDCESMLEIKATDFVLIDQNPVPQPSSWSFLRRLQVVLQGSQSGQCVLEIVRPSFTTTKCLQIISHKTICDPIGTFSQYD